MPVRVRILAPPLEKTWLASTVSDVSLAEVARETVVLTPPTETRTVPRS
jgi:hypothetical protein